MNEIPVYDLLINQGKTFAFTFRWGAAPFILKAISAITRGAPATVTATAHAMPDGWLAAVISAGGMDGINSESLSKLTYRQGTVVDANNVAFNSLDSSGFDAYTSGGYLVYKTPVDLSGFTARMAIRKALAPQKLLICTRAGTSDVGSKMPTGACTDGTVQWIEAAVTAVRTKTWAPLTAFAVNDVIDVYEVLRIDTNNGGIVVDNATKKVTLTITAAQTAQIWWKNGYYDIEMVSASGVVTGIMQGAVSLNAEATTP